MTNSVNDSGEWSLDDWRGMAERLKTFRPVDENGEPITDAAWAEMIGISPTSFSPIIRGNVELKMRNHQKIIFWLVSEAGASAEDVLWWQTGYRKESKLKVGGGQAVVVRHVNGRRLTRYLEPIIKKAPPPVPSTGKRLSGPPVSRRKN